MKSLGIAVALIGGAGAWASTICQPGSLSDYVALGAGGCVLQADGVTFTSPVVLADFTFTPVSGVAAGAADAIRIDPFPYPATPGVTISPQRTDGNNDMVEEISFTIAAPGIQSTWLWAQGGPLPGDGAVTVSATVCDSGGCSLLADPDANRSFDPVDSLSITDRFQFSSSPDGDPVGIAYLQNLVSRPGGYGSCQCGIVGGGPVPEPASLPLTGAGGIALLAIRRRWRRAPVE